MAIVTLDVVSRGLLNSPLSVAADGYLTIGKKVTGGDGGDVYFRSTADAGILHDDEDILAFIVSFMGIVK